MTKQILSQLQLRRVEVGKAVCRKSLGKIIPKIVKSLYFSAYLEIGR